MIELEFVKPWAYIEKSHCVNVAIGKAKIPDKHVKSAIEGKYAKAVKAAVAKPVKAKKAK